ncbi:MAG: polysaccharide deacetylase [Eubacterium sp.]|nr:polysaccharide deacetylase [Eubacterium sp.]
MFQQSARIDRLEEMINSVASSDATVTGESSDSAGGSTVLAADNTTESGDAGDIVYGVNAHQDIYLTFDDGPSDNTEAILDILDQYDVKATFFVIGSKEKKYKKLYKEIVERGHTIGMHSYTHKYSSLYDSVESFAAEITKEQDLIEKVTGLRPWLFRFPGGSSNDVSNADMNDLISYLNDSGITYYDWNVVGGDATSKSYNTKDVLKSVSNDIGKYKTAVILLHDANTKTATVEALGPLIEMLLERDADLKAIDEDTPLVQHISYESVE